MTERKLNVHSENWSEEPFAISRGIDDNFDVVVVELEQNGFKAWGEATPTEHYNESISQTESLIEDFRNRIENGISRKELQQEMPKGAAIINLGRGGDIIDNDLIAALDNGQLSAATLDVTEPEPLPNDSPLWDHPFITILPHVARRPPVAQIAPVFIENIRRFEANKPLLQLTNSVRGY